METYYLYTNDPAIVEFVIQLARKRKAMIINGFPNGFMPGCASSLLIYDKYLNKFSQYNGRNDIISFIREMQYKNPLF